MTQNLVRSTSNVLKSKLYTTLTLKNLSMRQYQIFLFITLIINIVFLCLQMARFGVIIMDEYGDDLTLVIIAFVLTTINCGYLIKLMYAPTPSFAVTCMGIILVQEVLFIVQTVLYYKYFVGYDAVIALSVIFLVLQLCSVIPVYRYWELILFNYDDGGWSENPSISSPSDVGLDRTSGSDNRKSTGHLHPSKVKSQLHIDKSGAKEPSPSVSAV
eukprot:CAMPEP_0185002564 /NCGR_PEP_ID=MMETSP1098-20130426/74180_1 /TAXON_ID=89044 /ORGANISM="Spumella elongata, Strain CCAP 955/1" /LENGTH=214 /DNA_ID=CAMNT_0027530073 /DNA_START=35 /DNA_END=679 /DNA_ORIENTATION=+